MKNRWIILTMGFALFSMFFGSGNLIFPLTLGKETGTSFWMAFLGLFTTAVIVPFAGVFAMWLYDGDPKKFFGTMGSQANFWFSLVILSLIGPFGVLARCITVAHGSFQLLVDGIDVIPFSIGFCFLLFLAIYKENKILSLLGSYLTPFLLVSLAVICLFGILAPTPAPLKNYDLFSAASLGVLQGYQTMDLLAAFFFSAFVLQQLNHYTTDKRAVLNLFLKSLAVGAILLSAVYAVFIFLGAKYAPLIDGIAPERLLGEIAYQAMGRFSAPFVCTAVILACFTTAIVLAKLYAEFFRREIAFDKVSSSQAIGLTLIIAFGVSTLEFSGIARFLGPILENLYPALIVLTVMNIVTALWGTKLMRWPIVVTFLAKFCFF